MSVFTFNSESHTTTSNIEQLFNFLSDFKNFKQILPEDKVDNFQYSGQNCSFSIKGVTPMSIKLVEKIPYSYMLFETDGLAKFNFKLKVHFEGNEGKPGICKVDLIGDLNPFIQTMVEKPLGQLINTMSLKLSLLKLD